MRAKPKPTSAERVRKHRADLKRAGLRPIQLWVPDTRDPKFREECRRQSQLAAHDPGDKEILEWIEKATEDTGWGEWKG